MRLFIIVCLLMAPLANAFASEARDRLDHFFNKIVSLDGLFTQEVLDEQGHQVQMASGSIKLLRPGRFVWDYEKPFKQLIIADGQFLWIYDSELEQATVKSIDKALGTAPIMLLSEIRSVDEDFIVIEEPPADGLEWVELQPKVKDTDFLRIRFGLNKEGIARMVLFDQFGQRTIIRFEKMKFNTTLAPSAFRFKVPPGVDVIRASD